MGPGNLLGKSIGSASAYTAGEVPSVAGGQQSYGRDQALFDDAFGKKVGGIEKNPLCCGRSAVHDRRAFAARR